MTFFRFHFFFLQQLFRSQNPSLASNAGVAPPGQPTAQQQIPQTLPLPSQQYLAQQSAAYAAAAQQPAPYVINPGQDAARYIGKNIAGLRLFCMKLQFSEWHLLHFISLFVCRNGSYTGWYATVLWRCTMEYVSSQFDTTAKLTATATATIDTVTTGR